MLLKDIKRTSVCQILNIESIRKDCSPKSIVIIYSASCHFQPKCLPFSWTQNMILWYNMFCPYNENCNWTKISTFNNILSKTLCIKEKYKIWIHILKCELNNVFKHLEVWTIIHICDYNICELRGLLTHLSASLCNYIIIYSLKLSAEYDNLW